MIIFIAAVIFFLIIASNYSPGTFLSIWDTIHTEFNFGLDIKRNFFSIWQEYRGLGLVDGMAHAADLPRQLLTLPLKYLLSLSSVRFAYHFLMLATGFIGVWIFLYLFAFPKKDTVTRQLAALAGSLFYLLNFGTIQYFLVPFESFSAFWGMFPWLIMALISNLRNPSRKNLFLLAILNLLAAPAFYIHTLFLVYLMVLAIICFSAFLVSKKLRKILIGLKIAAVILLIQSFWLLPAVYFLKNDARNPREAHINYMSSENTYLQNKRRGTLADFLVLKGYYYDFIEENGYMMESWRSHFSQIDAGNALYLLSLVGVAGIFLKNPVRKYVLPLYLFSAIPLLSGVALVDSFHTWIRDMLPFWDQVFRSPFTKFIVPAAFSLSAFFAISVGAIFGFVKKFFTSSKIYPYLFVGILSTVFLYQSYPVFNGHLFSNSAKVRIPLEYFQLFDYFEGKSPNERIALFPQQTYWGWMFYSWGYRGSGFIWQGLPQPVLDRTFDVWNKNNENYYWEISNALYSRNKALFEQVIRKYQIKWIIIDGNVVSFASSKVPFFEKTENLLLDSPLITLASSFGKIKVFKVNNAVPFKEFVALGTNLPGISPSYKWNQFDRAYQEYGNYLNEDWSNLSEDKFHVSYPFRSLFTGRKQEEKEFTLSLSDDFIEFSVEIPEIVPGSKLFIPKYSDEDILEINADDLSDPEKRYPEVILNDELITAGENTAEKVFNLTESKNSVLKIRVPKIYGLFSYENINSRDLDNSLAYDCDDIRKGELENNIMEQDGYKFLRISTLNTNGCLNYNLDVLSHKFSYLLMVDHRHISGNQLLIGINNQSSTRADQETLLPNDNRSVAGKFTTSSFILPPMEEFARGYTLRFENDSIGRIRTVNEIGRITVNPIPYRLITGIKILNGYFKGPAEFSETESFTVSHPNPSNYYVRFDTVNIQREGQYLILSQSYHPGWQAYRVDCRKESVLCSIKKSFPPLFFQKLENHRIINNWENGWLLDGARADPGSLAEYVIIFTPQYLQYLGFSMTILTIAALMMRSFKKGFK